MEKVERRVPIMGQGQGRRISEDHHPFLMLFRSRSRNGLRLDQREWLG